MNLGGVVAILLGLVALATALGLVWQSRNGRIRAPGPPRRRSSQNAGALPEVNRGEKATLLQFSTEVCAPCVPTRRVLGQIADSTDGVNHVDLYLPHRPALCRAVHRAPAPAPAPPRPRGRHPCPHRRPPAPGGCSRGAGRHPR